MHPTLHRMWKTIPAAGTHKEKEGYEGLPYVRLCWVKDTEFPRLYVTQKFHLPKLCLHYYLLGSVG